jgi:uncharacterized protein (DUF697 family)
MKGSQMSQETPDQKAASRPKAAGQKPPEPKTTEPKAAQSKAAEPKAGAALPVAVANVDAKAEADASAMTDHDRDVSAVKLVDRFALWSGAAALIPLPLVDMAAVGGLQLRMLSRLSGIYGIPYSENRAKAIMASFAGTLIPASAAPAAASVLKSFPGIGTAIAALTMPTFSAGATYMIGRAFIQHFASGGTLLDFDPPDYRKFVSTLRDDLSLGKGSASSAGSDTTAALGDSPRASA